MASNRVAEFYLGTKQQRSLRRRRANWVQGQLAEPQQSEAFKCVQNKKAELVALSGYPVEMTEGDLTGTVGAMIGMAWKHRRDYHVIVSLRNHDAILLRLQEGIEVDVLGKEWG